MAQVNCRELSRPVAGRNAALLTRMTVFDALVIGITRFHRLRGRALTVAEALAVEDSGNGAVDSALSGLRAIPAEKT